MFIERQCSTIQRAQSDTADSATSKSEHLDLVNIACAAISVLPTLLSPHGALWVKTESVSGMSTATGNMSSSADVAVYTVVIVNALA